MNRKLINFWCLNFWLIFIMAFSNYSETNAQINETKPYYKKSINNASELHDFYKKWADEQKIVLSKYDDNNKIIYTQDIKVIVLGLSKNRNKLIATIFQGIEVDMSKTIIDFKADNITASILSIIIKNNIERYTSDMELDFFKKKFKENKNDYKNSTNDFYNDLNKFNIDSLFQDGLIIQKEKDAKKK